MSTHDQLCDLARDLPDLALLTTTRAPGTAQGGARAAGSKPPINLTPLAVDAEVKARLVGWVRICVEDRVDLPEGHEGPSRLDWPADDTQSIVRFLVPLAAILDAHEAGDDWQAEVAWCHQQVRQALGERDTSFPCPQCGVPASVDSTGRHAQCSLGHEIPVGDFGRRQVNRPPITTDKVVAQFDVTADQLYQWHQRGQIAPAGKDGRRLLWRPWDVFRNLQPELAAEIEWAVQRDIELGREAG